MADYTSLPEAPKMAIELRRVFEKKYGYWREVGPFWSLPFWVFVAAVEKANGFDADAIDKAMADLGVVRTPVGKVVMIKGPDRGINRNVDALVTPMLARVRGDRAVFVARMTIEEAINAFEQAIGSKGQWK
ncbi:MAG: hypothetical protein JRJ66_05570 [Deltaproteobacteria bacterium]|nr:hypothetical protein [Deltaproteobacteria bacterium]MBW2044335.1 hypothetical protein [Deltaproteobacteria bacterium]